MRFESGQFDLHQLSRQIDEARRDRDLTWSEIAQEVGVSTSTIRRFATASDAEADGVLALIGWLGIAPEQFVVGGVAHVASPSTRGYPHNNPTTRDGSAGLAGNDCVADTS